MGTVTSLVDGRKSRDAGDETIHGPLSHIAVRDDGALMVSVDDCADRDLSGREMVQYVVLRADEETRARELVDEYLPDVVSRIIAGFPKALPHIE